MGKGRPSTAVTAWASTPTGVCGGGLEAWPPWLCRENSASSWPFSPMPMSAQGLLTPGKHMLHHGAALIHDQRGADVPGFQHIDDLRCAVAHDLFIAGKEK